MMTPRLQGMGFLTKFLRKTEIMLPFILYPG